MTNTVTPARVTAADWPEVIGRLLRREDLTADESAWAMDQVMAGAATPAQVAGFVVALRAKGESVGEVQGLVAAMLSHARTIDVPGPAVDSVGTGGDRSFTVNLSTMAAIVAAGAGATVVKHGNRAASSACGSADLLAELGVAIDLAPELVAACVEEVGIGFCFAPVFHPAMRHAAVPRRELGVPTVFNILGPLSNPARPAAQAVGCADLRLAPLMAGVLAGRGITALVFRGEDGLDELTVTGPSQVWIAHRGEVVQRQIDPLELGIGRASAESLRGGEPAVNARIARQVFAGAPGAVRDAVLLNAAAALTALAAVGDAGSAQDVADSLEARLSEALGRAAKAVDDGSAEALLERWIEVSKRLAA